MKKEKMGRPSKKPNVHRKTMNFCVSEENQEWLYAEADRLDKTLSQIVNESLTSARMGMSYSDLSSAERKHGKRLFKALETLLPHARSDF